MSEKENSLSKELSKRYQQGIKDEFVRNAKAFCMMPWVHLHVTQSGSVTSCCVAPWDEGSFGNINQDKIKDIWESQAIRDFRLKLLEDLPDKRCERCYHFEKEGVHSLRQSVNNLYQHHIDKVKQTDPKGYTKGSNPVYLDIRYSNLCNFKCRICGPWSSTSWYEDALSLGQIQLNDDKLTRSVSNLNELFEQMEDWVADLEEVYFAGGEPLIMDEHYQFLRELDRKGKYDLLLRYSTNLSVLDYKKRSVTDWWNKFSRIHIAASLDDMGKRAEYQRKGQDWAATELNVRRLKRECPHIYFMLSPTISIFNILTIGELHKYATVNEWINIEDIWPNLLESPEYFNIRILPQELKMQATQHIKLHIHWIEQTESSDPFRKKLVIDQFYHVLRYMHSEDWSHLRGEMRTQIFELDKLRNEKFADVFPELASAIQ